MSRSSLVSFRVLLLAGFLIVLGSGGVAAGPVNINTADATTLARELQGIGLKRAQAIVDYRTKYGPFKSADELALVKGIGAKAIERNKADIRLEMRASIPPAPTKKQASKPLPRPEL